MNLLLENSNILQNKTQTLYTQSNQHQEKLKLFNDFYTEFFKTPSTENDDKSAELSKIEHFRNIYNDMLTQASNLEQKSQDVEKSYEKLQQIIQVSIGYTEEDWSIARYIYTYVDRLSNIDNYKKELNKANKDITIYRDQIESLKEEFVRTKEDIQKLLNPAATISLSNSYKETREKDYKKLSWSMGGNYALFLLPLLLILIYFLYPSLLG